MSTLLARLRSGASGADAVALRVFPPAPGAPIEWTYAQLWAHATDVGRRLTGAHALQPGQRVALAVREGAELALLTVALLAHRLVLVPIDVDDPVERLRAVIDDTEPALVVCASELAHRRDALRAAGAARVVDARELCGGRGGGGVSGSRAGADAALRPPPPDSGLAALDALLAAEADGGAFPAMDDGRAVSHIFFTSGSTGRPKGCVVQRAALAAYCAAHARAHDVRPGDVVLVASAHTFDPCLGEMASALCAGATVALAPRRELAAALGGCLARARATHVTTTPTAWRAVDPARPPASLRVVALGGEPMPLPLAASWSGQVVLLNTYGTTEACVYQAACRVREPADARLLGEPFVGTRLFLAADDGADWRARVREGSGDEGEIWVGGAQVGLGYAGGDARVAAECALRFVHVDERDRAEAGGNVLYRTGDIAAATARGWVLRGRRDGQVKVRGRRLELDEIEAAIEAAAAEFVSAVGAYVNARGALVVWCVLRGGSARAECGGDAAETAVGGARAEHAPAAGAGADANDAHVAAIAADAALARTRGASLARAAARLLCATRLAAWAVPSTFALTRRALPCTASGKLDRRALRAWPLPTLADELLDAVAAECVRDEGVRDGDDAAWEAEGWEAEGWEAEGALGSAALPSTKAERAVAAAWAAVLAIPYGALRSGSSFVELGGDSLAALDACRRLATLDARGADARAGAREDGWGLELRVGPLELLRTPRLRPFARLLARSERELARAGPGRVGAAGDADDDARAGDGSDAPDGATHARARARTALSGVGCTSARDVAARGMEDGGVEADAAEALGADAGGETQRLDDAAAIVRLAASAGEASLLRALLPMLMSAPSTPPAAVGAAVAATDGERAVAAALRAACAAGRVECARACLRACPRAARVPGPRGELALHAAVRAPSAHVVALVLGEAGAMIGVLDDHAQTAVHHAARAGAPARVLDALRAGGGGSDDARARRADGAKRPATRGRGGRSAGLDGAAAEAAWVACVNRRDAWGRTALHWAALNGHAHAAEWLLAAGADRAAVDAAGESALQMAERRALCSAAERAGAGPPARWSAVAKALGGAGTTRALRTSKAPT
ncbi:hypothetical protein KFE25_007697 [Diacronema lutheri]|uniref:AMP-dependent synthetase/ligase domain-containing protein n=1 Tax=Diacronema lutheri TaxID=2081491 RepID=A0A8J6CE09_DIALT|nr:hypothetical protein KFE25_007697 [Diacronema lutheri]